jgi:aminopeptidase-like protein
MMALTDEIRHYMELLFPVTRSITGRGSRETLSVLQEIVPLNLIEYPSGLTVFDWTVPDEWRVREAWIRDSAGRTIVDFSQCNLHLVSYSEAVSGRFGFDDLRPHLHSHEDLPNAVPYRTTYFRRDWGFCITRAQMEALENSDGPLEVLIDSEFDADGSLTIGELLIPGESGEEILVSTYICHPSLANDNLSGTVMTAFLARELLAQARLRHSYRFIWVPETIGAIAYCAMNEEAMKKVQSGLVVTSVGGPGSFGYKQSYNPHHSVNALIEEVLVEEGIDFVTYPFDIHGSDERQYSSQGFRINVASLTKDKYYEYPYYHTSLDDLNFVKAEHIVESLRLHLKVLAKLDAERTYRSLVPGCEVMLSKHGLYPVTGGAQLPDKGDRTELDLILWLLWMCDGRTGTHEMARRLGVSTSKVLEILTLLEAKQVVERIA